MGNFFTKQTPEEVSYANRTKSFELNRSHLLHTIENRLARQYKLDINMAVLDKEHNPKSDVGSLALAYVAGFIYHLAGYTAQGSNRTNINSFNHLVTKHKITIVPDERLHMQPGCRVKDGVFEITFDPAYPGHNPFDACKHMGTALDHAALVDDERIRQKAQASFEENWSTAKRNFEPLFKHELHGDSRGTVNLNVDFEDIWPKLAHAEKRNRDGDITELAEKVGNHVYEHFHWLDHAIDHYFGTDLERITAFLDHIPNGIRLEVVDDDALKPLSQGRDCDCEFEAGALVMKTTPSKFPYPSTWVEGAVQLILGRFK